MIYLPTPISGTCYDCNDDPCAGGRPYADAECRDPCSTLYKIYYLTIEDSPILYGIKSLDGVHSITQDWTNPCGRCTWYAYPDWPSYPPSYISMLYVAPLWHIILGIWNDAPYYKWCYVQWDGPSEACDPTGLYAFADLLTTDLCTPDGDPESGSLEGWESATLVVS